MNYLKLKFSMYGSIAAMIAVVTLALAFLIGFFTSIPSMIVLVIVIPLFVLQWRFAPQIIERAHKVEPASEEEYPQLHKALEEIAKVSKMEKPQLMIAKTKIPNAFAYGNMWSGKKIAVTKGLLDSLEFEEVEAVIGHEMGHHKHGDGRAMMFLSVLPAIFLMIGRVFLLSGFFGGGGRRNGLPLMAIAGVSMGIYLVLNLCIMNFSRTREFFADRFSAENVPDGARKLSEGLAKISHRTERMKEEKRSEMNFRGRNQTVYIAHDSSGRRVYVKGPEQRKPSRNETGSLGMSLKPLFISDPDTSYRPEKEELTDQELVEMYSKQKLTFKEKLMEIFSTHPSIKKRLSALEKLSVNILHSH